MEVLVEKTVRKSRKSSTKTSKAEATLEEAKDIIKNGYVLLEDYFEVPVGVYELLNRNIRKAKNTLILGPTGLGKTELIYNLAKHNNMEITIFDMGTMTDAISGLVGTHIITVKDGLTTSKFCKSRFSEAIQKKGIILLDELNRASAQALNLLFPCLDFRRELPMEYSFEDMAPVKVHPECVFMATANVGSQYTGTHKVDRALLDRFNPIELDTLTSEKATDILKKAFTNVSAEDLANIVSIYTRLQKAHDDFKISFSLSFRHLKEVTEMVNDGFTIYDSYYALCRGVGGMDGLKAIKEFVKTK